MSFNAWVQFLADCPGYSADKASFALAKARGADPSGWGAAVGAGTLLRERGKEPRSPSSALVPCFGGRVPLLK